MTGGSQGDVVGVRRRKHGKPASIDEDGSSAPGERVTSSGSDSAEQSPFVLPESDRRRSPIARLWLQSRLTRDESTGQVMYQLQGHDRALSIDNLRIAFHLAKALRHRLLGLLWEKQKWSVVFYLMRRMMQGTIPAGRIWAQARMMDLVQRSLETGKAEPATVFKVAGTSLAFTTFDTIYDFVSRGSDRRVRMAINHSMERAYLSAQMSLSIPAISTPYVSALMYEAEVFIGSKPHTTRDGETRCDVGGPFQTICYFISAVTCGIELVTQLALLLNALLGSGSESWGLGRVLLVFFSLGPTMLRLGGNWMVGSPRRWRSRGTHLAMRQWHQLERTLREMGTNGNYKQENVLFGLKEWVLTQWDAVRQATLQEENRVTDTNRVKGLGLSLSKSSMETMFYVMLALRWTGSTISLGTVRLYQSVAQQLTSTLSHLTMVLERAYQTIFYLAAYIEATTNLDATDMAARPWTGTSKATLTDYEAIRNEGGLSIRARNVNYTYPTADKPALHNINIDIRAGETLAIVGYNGGGKSTLVKVLMGLYDHDGNDGDLLINGVPLRQIDHVSLHRRTSCLFQNFNKYPLSLRENIGVGSFQHMADGDLIKRAVARGGADAVVNKVGLERKLLPAEVTDPDDMVPETPVNAAAVGGDLQPMEARDAPVTVSDAIKPENGTLSKANAAEVDFSAQTLEVEPSAGNRSSGQSPVLRFGNSDPKNGVHPTPKGGKGSVGPAKDDKRIGLSGGQWQRIALARAFLRSDEADLVIFDEPSASLDPQAEAALFQRIHALSTAGGKRATTIYISHRFSTVRKADQIAVVEDGTITEIGGHSELMALRGRYAELFNLQKEAYEE